MSTTTEGAGGKSVRARWLRAFAVGVAILALSGVLAGISSYAIQALYPDRPRPPDLLFDLLPYFQQLQFAVEVFYIAGIVLFAIYALRPAHRRQIPEYIALFGIMEIFRAAIIILTPLAVPYDPATHFTANEAIRNWGEFPSGHIATMLLFFLLVAREDAPGIRRALAALMVAEIVVLLISHSHYSVDIVGGLLLGYFVYHSYYKGRLFDWLKPLLEV